MFPRFRAERIEFDRKIIINAIDRERKIKQRMHHIRTYETNTQRANTFGKFFCKLHDFVHETILSNEIREKKKSQRL